MLVILLLWLLTHGHGELLPDETEAVLNERVGALLQRGEGVVDLGFVSREERVEVREVEVCGALGLRQGEVEQEKRFDGVVEWHPMVRGNMEW